MRSILWTASALLLGLCAWSGCADSALDGTVGGEAFGDVQSAIFIDKSTEDLQQIELVLSTWGDGCETYHTYLEEGADPAGNGPFHALSTLFVLFDPLQPGSYPILKDGEFLPDPYSAPEAVNSHYYTYQDNDWSILSADSGSIQVDTFDGTSMSGTLSVTLTSGESLTGKFQAAGCP